MMEIDLERLVVRHRHVAPMLSVLLGGTNAAVRIRDASGTVILEREGDGIGADSFPIVVEGETVGSVEGGRIARAVAAVLSYASAREADKRSLANEALERYRELNLVYNLAEALSGLVSVAAIGQSALAEVNRLPGDGVGVRASRRISERRPHDARRGAGRSPRRHRRRGRDRRDTRRWRAGDRQRAGVGSTGKRR
jgi:hypothetical protein